MITKNECVKSRRTVLKYMLAAAGLSITGKLMAKDAVLEHSLSKRQWGKTMDNTKQVKLSDKEWKARLSEMAYKVLRKEGTERSGTSALNHEKRTGEYLCAGCGLLLFTSNLKFDSGTGWPSFFDVVEGHVETKKDFKLIYPRTEYHCARCGGHQGHVFNDGPKPTGKRYCNNGVALTFEEKS